MSLQPTISPRRTPAAGVAAMFLTALALVAVFTAVAVDHVLRGGRPVGQDLPVAAISAGVAVLSLGWLRLARSRPA